MLILLLPHVITTVVVFFVVLLSVVHRLLLRSSLAKVARSTRNAVSVAVRSIVLLMS